MNLSHGFYIIIIFLLVGISCSTVGVFLVLRKMSMLGDAISHSVLFGIVMSYIITGSRSPLVMFIGASIVGFLTAYLTNILNSIGKLQEDASIGVTFTWLFALGVILISVYAGRIDLDTDCVLYGEIAFAPFNTITFFGHDIGPKSIWILIAVTIIDFIFIIFAYKPLKLVSFDPITATSLGINNNFWHYILMTFVSITTVAAFESVGAILVVAMLVIPPNVGYLLGKSVIQMFLIAYLCSAVSGLLGYQLSSYYDASISASIVCISGSIFILVLICQKFAKSTSTKTNMVLNKLQK